MLLLSEFESMTGIYPPTNLFVVIQEYFEKSRFDKQEFCRRYGLNVNRIAEEIQIETNVRACEDAWKAGMMLGETKLENEKAVVKILAEILKRAGEISTEDFDAIMKQCKIQK
ncbi:MAG: hypothetical protein K2O52_02255 [Oscillospiraceae bacterium]|nr:hypothetical protein [Oscillospiraceae bacterium]MDE7093713.1 hypothetical protein [Oscillospiraceae bacterium]